MGRLCAVVLVLLPSLASADTPVPVPSTAEADVELAKAHYRTGEIYYERARYPDAAREFEEAYRLSGRPEMLYNMGKSYDGVGDHARALAAYRRWLGAVTTAPDRPAVVERLAALTRLVGRVTIKTSVDGAAVKLDGAAVGDSPLPGELEVNPGAHKLEVSKEGFRTFRGQFVASPDGTLTVSTPLESLVQVVQKVIEVERKEKATPVYKRWWLWTVVGAAVVAGAVTGGVLGSQQPPVSGAFAQLPVVK